MKNINKIILLLITICLYSCDEKVVIVETQSKEMRIDTIFMYKYKIKREDGTVDIHSTTDHYKMADTIGKFYN